VFNNNAISNLQGEQRFMPILLSGPTRQTDWQNTFVYNRQKQAVPLRSLITVTPTTDYAVVYTDKEGPFVPFDFETDSQSATQLQQRVSSALQTEPGVLLSWSGRYFRDQTYLTELIGIVAVSIALLFCILVAQFESVQQPLIVLLIVALGLAGAIWALYLFGNSLNVLSAIGMVVLIGLLDNDSILKIDTMNRGANTMSLMEAIRLGGQRRLKSQIMTFMTTVLGLLPVLFSGGLGSELQQPLALAVIGGMCVGVLASWTVIPLLYWWLAHRS
jgi:multidrug efflux pump subunit AcrB